MSFVATEHLKSRNFDVISHGLRRRYNDKGEQSTEAHTQSLMVYDEILMKIPMQSDEYVCIIGKKLNFKHKIGNGEYLLGRIHLPKFKCHFSFVFQLFPLSTQAKREKESTISKIPLTF